MDKHAYTISKQTSRITGRVSYAITRTITMPDTPTGTRVLETRPTYTNYDDVASAMGHVHALIRTYASESVSSVIAVDMRGQSVD